jgi:hypothetical protein
MCFSAMSADYVPPQAFQYKDMISSELDKHFPNIPNKHYIPALFEHESCISLKHKRCWNSKSQLKTSREEGAGLLQITRAYNADGSLRFDSLYEMRTRYKTELKDASWSTIYGRPDVQIRMGILMSRDNYNKLYDVPDSYEKLKMADAAYNGGMGGLQKERRLCGLTKGCNPNVWFGNVERMTVKSMKPIYGNRSPWDINRHHVADVINTRMPKYERVGYYD